MLLASLVVPACFAPAAPPGTLVVANNSEVHSLDPQIASGAPEGRVLSALFAGLTSLDPIDLSPRPELAESFHSPDGGRSWVFSLREDLKWSDGSPLTSADFVRSWKRLRSPKTGAPYREWLDDLAPDGLRANGKLLEVKFNNPVPWFASMCSWYALAPLPIGLINGQQGAGQISSGPFKLAFHRLRDRVRVIPNPHYYRAKTVKLPAIDFMVVESQFTALNLFLSGDAHLIPDVPALAVNGLLQSHPQEFEPTPAFATYFYRFNVEKSPTNDPLVRQALSLAIDRTQLAKTLASGQSPAFSFVPPFLDNYQPPHLAGFNLSRAKQLLIEAGYDAENPLPSIEIHFNSAELHRDVAEAVQAQGAQNLEVSARLYNQEWKVFIDAQRQLDYQVSRSSWIGDYLDPSTFLNIFHSKSKNNRTGWNSPAYDQLLAKIQNSNDQKSRMQLCKEAELLLLDAAPILPLFFYSNRELVSTRLKGFERNLIGRIDWSTLSWLTQDE